MSSLPRPETEPDPLEYDLSHLRGDLPYYGARHLKIRTKSEGLQPLVFNRAQMIVHELLSAQMRETGQVRAIILKARQEGISTYTAARFFRRATMYPDQEAVVIADQRSRGKTLFKIYETFDRRIAGELKPAKRAYARGNELHYDTTSGTGLNSRITVETAMDDQAGRGSTIQALHASELAFWENPEETWTALMQAVPDHGSEVIIESTANGVGNMFHQFWVDATNGESSFIPIFLPWFIHEEYTRPLSEEAREEVRGSLSEWEARAVVEGLPFAGETVKLTFEQIAWRRATIRDKLRGDEATFKQEYPSTAKEAFLVSGNCFFDEDALAVLDERTRLGDRYRLVTKGRAMLRIPDGRGELRIWTPPNRDGQYVIFADTATGKRSGERGDNVIYAGDREQGGRDFSAAWVYDAEVRRFVALLHSRKIPPERFAERLFELGFIYSHRFRGDRMRPALLGVERNHSSGETVVKELQRLGYTNLFMDRQLNKRRNRMTQAVGWITTEAKRQVMLDDFSAWLRETAEETIGDLPAELPCEDTIRECYTFIRTDEGKPEATEGCHDDRVIAAAGCIQMARHHYSPAVSSRQRTGRLVRKGGPVGHLEWEEEDGHAVIEEDRGLAGRERVAR